MSGIIRSRLTHLSILIFGVVVADTVFAQQVLGPNPVIAGHQVQCGGAVAVVQPISDIAMARPGYIILNPVFFSLPPALQLFIYAHECGHHVQGPDESGADCWAVQTGRKQGWFARQDIAWIQQYFGASPGDWTHAPGPYRVAHIMNCFDAVQTGDDEDQSSACEDRCEQRASDCEERCDTRRDPDACIERCQSRYEWCLEHCD